MAITRIFWRRTALPASSPAAGADRPGGWDGLAYVRLHGAPAMYHSPYSPDALALRDRLG